MKKIILHSAVFSVALILLTSCGITPMFNPPLDKDSIDAVSPELTRELIGNWTGEKANFSASPHIEERDGVKTPSESVLKVDYNIFDDNQKKYLLLPLLAVPFRAGDHCFVLFMTDLERVARLADCPDEIIFMLRPYYFAAEISLDNDKLTLSVIKWQKRNDQTGNEVISDELVVISNGVMMTESPEILKLLAAGKYFKDKEMEFTRLR